MCESSKAKTSTGLKHELWSLKQWKSTPRVLNVTNEFPHLCDI